MTEKKKMLMLSLAFVAAMLASWILNFGLLRGILTAVLFPVFNAGLFVLANVLAAKHFDDCKALRPLAYLSFLTFLLPHLLVNDGGDAGSYIFFGLISNERAVDVATDIGLVAYALHVAVIIAQFVLIIIAAKKAKKADAAEIAEA